MYLSFYIFQGEKHKASFLFVCVYVKTWYTILFGKKKSMWWNREFYYKKILKIEKKKFNSTFLYIKKNVVIPVLI